MFKILEANELTTNIFQMIVEAPRVAGSCLPGQFLIIRVHEDGERIPLTICSDSLNYYLNSTLFSVIVADSKRDPLACFVYLYDDELSGQTALCDPGCFNVEQHDLIGEVFLSYYLVHTSS